MAQTRRRVPEWKTWPKTDVRVKLRNWAMFPLVLGLWESVERFGGAEGFAIYLAACFALRPILRVLLQYLPPARQDWAWLGAVFACCFAIPTIGALGAMGLYGALFLLWLALGAGRRQAAA